MSEEKKLKEYKKEDRKYGIHGKEHRRNIYCSENPCTLDVPLKDGNRDTILQWIYDIKLVPWYVSYLLKGNPGEERIRDAIQYMWLEICKVSDERWNNLYTQGYLAISSFVTGIIHRQLKSDSSNYYRAEGKYKEMFKVMDNEEFWQKINDTYGEEEQRDAFSRLLRRGEEVDEWANIENGIYEEEC